MKIRTEYVYPPMKEIRNVEVTCSERSNYALGCEYDGAAYHVWLDRKTRALEKPVLYKNSLTDKRHDPGYFNTRKLSTESKFARDLVPRMMDYATHENLFEKAEQKVLDDRAAEIADTEKMLAAERVKAAAPELLKELEHICAEAESWHSMHHGQNLIQCDSICKAIPGMKAALAKANRRTRRSRDDPPWKAQLEAEGII